MEDWDQERLEKVVESKNEYGQNRPTEIVCLFSNLKSSIVLSGLLVLLVEVLHLKMILSAKIVICFIYPFLFIYLGLSDSRLHSKYACLY